MQYNAQIFKNCFARLVSFTNYAEHCGVKVVSALKSATLIFNLFKLSPVLIHLPDSFTPLMLFVVSTRQLASIGQLHLRFSIMAYCCGGCLNMKNSF